MNEQQKKETKNIIDTGSNMGLPEGSWIGGGQRGQRNSNTW